LHTNDYPVSYNIKKIISDCGNVKSFELETKMDCEPGQFVMLWIPGFDEKPFALTKTNPATITARTRGVFTQKLFEMRGGEKLGLRGPYGKGFSLDGIKRACIVSGGIGSAAVLRLAEELKKKGTEIDFVFGCRNKEELLFKERIESVAELHVATEDGSCGTKGYCTGILEKLLSEKKHDLVYCCGPEKMMLAVLGLCNKFDAKAEFALERYIKCAQGICGQCSIDTHLCCKDGPVFSREQLNESEEFGKVHYLKDGKKENI